MARNNTKVKSLTTVDWLFREVGSAYPHLDKSVFEIAHTRPESIYDAFKFLFYNLTYEQVVCFWMNNRGNIIGFEIVTKGVLDASLVSIREIFRGAIVNTAKHIVLAHNHPSGNLKPSPADDDITSKCVKAGELLGISLRDHIIFSNTDFFSYANEGKL